MGVFFFFIFLRGSLLLHKCSSLCLITEFTREYQESEHAHLSACMYVCVRVCVSKEWMENRMLSGCEFEHASD